MVRDVTFAGSTVRIDYDPEAGPVVDFVLKRMPAPTAAPAPHATLALRREDAGGGFTLDIDGATVSRSLTRGAAGRQLLERLLFHLADRSHGGLLLHAAALTRAGTCVLFPGRTGSGKTTLAAWLAGRGFGYLTDELVCIPAGTLDVVPFVRPLNVRNGALGVLGLDAEGGDTDFTLSAPGITLIWPHGGDAHDSFPVPLDRIVFPTYRPGAALEPKALTPADMGLHLMGCLINARNLEGHGFGDVARIARDIPAFRVTYGRFEGLDEWIGAEAAARL